MALTVGLELGSSGVRGLLVGSMLAIRLWLVLSWSLCGALFVLETIVKSKETS